MCHTKLKTDLFLPVSRGYKQGTKHTRIKAVSDKDLMQIWGGGSKYIIDL